MNRKRKLIVAVTGASGSIYARLLCERLAKLDTVGEIALIQTANGHRVAAFEDDADWLSHACFTSYENDNLFGAPASGSASYDAMIIVPCSMGMAGRIASGISNDLVSRAADVMLKERRRLILVTREAPLNTIHLRNLLQLSEAGTIICPASPSFYSQPQTIDDLCNTLVERLLSLLGLEVPHYEWGSDR